jgi:hypothetical protein
MVASRQRPPLTFRPLPLAWPGWVSPDAIGLGWAGNDVHADSAAAADQLRPDRAGGPQRRQPGAAGRAEHQLSGVLRLGERQQRGRDVGAGQLVVGAAERDGQLPLGGELGATSSGRPRRPGDMHGQQGPSGPGGDPCRPADQRLALRAAAERDHHPLPGMTVTRSHPAGARPPPLAGQLASQPQQGELTQRAQGRSLEPAAQRCPGSFRRVDVPVRQAFLQRLRRHVHQLDLARRADHWIRHGFPARDSGDLLGYVAERFQLTDSDCGDHVDACGQQLHGVLPSPGVSRARHVAVGEIVDQGHRGPAG